MTGEWVRKRPYWWQYFVAGADGAHHVADVLQQREGLGGGLWDALPTGSLAPLVEDVSLEEAKAAVELYREGRR